MPKKTTVPFEKAFKLMATAKHMAELYEREKETTSKYVHATSRGHEAAQLALALQLEPKDFVAPYYRDDSLLLGIGMTPKDLMLQLLAKVDDPFSGGRTYYSHPSLKDDDKPKIPHQSSATGMQAIPTAGVAMGIQYREQQELATEEELGAIAVCSIGDSAMTEGEISEAIHMAALKQFPLLMFVQRWHQLDPADDDRLLGAELLEAGNRFAWLRFGRDQERAENPGQNGEGEQAAHHFSSSCSRARMSASHLVSAILIFFGPL